MTESTVGIVGAGEIVSKAHIPALLGLPNVEIGWIFDTDSKRCMATSRAFGIRPALSRDDIGRLPADVVLLGIPYGVRAPYFDMFADRAIYVEKPFARTVEEHEKRCRRFPDHKLACGLQRRFWGPVRTVKGMLAQNMFGPLRRARFGYGRPCISPGGGYSTNLAVAGGGLLFENAIHGIDTVLFVTDASTISVKHKRMIAEGGFDVDTEAALVVDSPFGKFDFEILATCLRESIGGVELVFDGVTLTFDVFGPPKVKARSRTGQEYELVPDGGVLPADAPDTLLLTWRSFLSGLRTGEPSDASASRSLLTTAVIEQLYADASSNGHSR
jgi:predicted dehydrogenase